MPFWGELLATMIDALPDPPDAPVEPMPPVPEDGLQGIQDVAKRLGVTHRTLRFYEDKGLIEPARVGNTRIYSHREVARMQLILRGKRLGFTIREIKEFTGLTPRQLRADPGRIAALSVALRHDLRGQIDPLVSEA